MPLGISLQKRLSRSSMPTSITIQKRDQYNLKQIAAILEHNNLTIRKADKGKSVVIISKDALREKIGKFIQTNGMSLLTRDPMDHYQKQLSQTMQKCTSVINKGQIKYLTQMKPTAPRLEALIKTHMPNNTIRPVINNIGAPSYKLAKFLNKHKYL
jgi:hypothetical protein